MEAEISERSNRPMLTIMQIIAWTLKMILRILLIPVVLILTILYWVGTVIVAFSTWVLDLIGGLFIMTGLLSFGFGLEPASEMWRLVTIGIGFCVAPMAAGWVVTRFAVLAEHVNFWLIS